MWGYPRCLRLNNLSPPHLSALGCDVGVVGHILGFKWRDMNAKIVENTTEGCYHDAFPYIRTCSEYGDAFCLGLFLFIFHLPILSVNHYTKLLRISSD